MTTKLRYFVQPMSIGRKYGPCYLHYTPYRTDRYQLTLTDDPEGNRPLTNPVTSDPAPDRLYVAVKKLQRQLRKPLYYICMYNVITGQPE